jgi:hypothetical protein
MLPRNLRPGDILNCVIPISILNKHKIDFLSFFSEIHIFELVVSFLIETAFLIDFVFYLQLDKIDFGGGTL